MKLVLQILTAGLFLAGLGLLVTERGRVAALRTENERLRAELAAAQRSIDSIKAQQNRELEQLRTEVSEVHKLRNEVTQLRAGAKTTEQLRAENPAAPKAGGTTPPATVPQEGYYAKENWTFSGYATPEAALQSVVWAMREGDTKTILGAVTPEEMARMQSEWAGKSEAEISADAKRGTEKINSIRILDSRAISEDEVVLNVYAAGGEDKIQKISMKRLGGEWRMAGPKKE
ncbi:MAG: DUF4878 domain-containing protein [Verrucomicrobia bacterium]|nr:MAG: DUF4878 domain-containing protein [Verrucomicrobiota bacterium]